MFTLSDTADGGIDCKECELGVVGEDSVDSKFPRARRRRRDEIRAFWIGGCRSGSSVSVVATE